MSHYKNIEVVFALTLTKLNVSTHKTSQSLGFTSTLKWFEDLLGNRNLVIPGNVFFQHPFQWIAKGWLFVSKILT